MSAPSYLEPGSVAVVTGAAGAIGKALARTLAERGLSVCLSDLPGPALDALAEEIGAERAFAAPVDLAEPTEIDRLRDAVLECFGAPHLLVNNAVTRIGRGHDADLDTWRRAMEVNFWGVVGGVRAFLPGMLARGERGAIVNLGSKQGVTNPPGHPIYNIAKSAVKTYTEALEHELRGRPDNAGEGRVSAHLLIPGWTVEGAPQTKPGAWSPEQVVAHLFERLAAESFYILCPDNEVSAEMDHRRMQWGVGDIVEDRPPLSRWHADFAERAKQSCS